MFTENRKLKTENRLWNRFGREYLATAVDRRQVYVILLPWVLGLALLFGIFGVCGRVLWPFTF